MKRQPNEWDKVFANDMADKGLISKINKQLIQLSNNQKKKKLNNGQKTWIDIFPKKTYRWLKGTWKDVQHHSLLDKWNADGNNNKITPHSC